MTAKELGIGPALSGPQFPRLKATCVPLSSLMLAFSTHFINLALELRQQTVSDLLCVSDKTPFPGECHFFFFNDLVFPNSLLFLLLLRQSSF